ncbi:Triosephosphate isomerase [Sinorhizobium alkalisoli]|nr:Triosephosphate isomerase [Sinorhizobium alkalisoli]
MGRHQLEDAQDLGGGAGLRRGLAAADAEHDIRVQRLVIPPFTAVRQVKEKLRATSVKVGGQNMHWEDAGA